MDPTLVCICVSAAALILSFSDARMRPGGVPVPSRARSWTSSLSMTEAGTALGTVGQRIGYSLDRAGWPDEAVLVDGAVAASYGQVFPVSLTSSEAGTVVRVTIFAKDPKLALTDAVQERRLDTLARTMRAIFVDAETNAGRAI